MTKMMDSITAGVCLPMGGKKDAVIRTFGFSGDEVGGRFRPSTATSVVMMKLTSEPAPDTKAALPKENRDDVSPMDTMSVPKIRAAESLAMDGVVGIQPSPITYGKGPDRPYLPMTARNAEEAAAMLRGEASISQGFKKGSMQSAATPVNPPMP